MGTQTSPANTPEKIYVRNPLVTAISSGCLKLYPLSQTVAALLLSVSVELNLFIKYKTNWNNTDWR